MGEKLRTHKGYKTRHKIAPLDKDGMPKWVPVFEAEDMIDRVFHSGERHCAVGWAEVLGLPCAMFRQAYRDANRTYTTSIHNDHDCETDQERADALNAAMRELGYVHIEEAD